MTYSECGCLMFKIWNKLINSRLAVSYLHQSTLRTSEYMSQHLEYRNFTKKKYTALTKSFEPY